MEEESEVRKFYAGRKVFITGVSGFIGKVLLWKLLYSCSSIDKIYVLIRSKRGVPVQARLDNILTSPVSHIASNYVQYIITHILAEIALKYSNDWSRLVGVGGVMSSCIFFSDPHLILCSENFASFHRANYLRYRFTTRFGK